MFLIIHSSPLAIAAKTSEALQRRSWAVQIPPWYPLTGLICICLFFSDIFAPFLLMVYANLKEQSILL